MALIFNCWLLNNEKTDETVIIHKETFKKDSDILIINCILILSYFGEAENNMNYFI